jgi:hypothetical protein
MSEERRKWHDIPVKEAVHIWLPDHPEITAPRNEMGEPCPWPWDPQQLVGQPIGQYHCGYCGAMVIAGMAHIDYDEATS